MSETDANGDVTKFAYDRAGNLVSLVDAEGNETVWQHDALDRVTRERNTLGYSRSFQYDLVGNLTQKIDRNGHKVTYGHDRFDRTTSEQWFADAADMTADRTFSFSYDLAGRMTNSNDPDHYYTYQFDDLDRLGMVEEWLIGMNVPVKFSYGYDTAGNKRTELATINYSWNDYYKTLGVDGLGRVTSVVQQSLGAHVVASKRVDFAYDLAGQRDWVKRYASTGTTNAVASTDYTWDLAGRLTTIDHRQGSTPGSGTLLAGYAYTWNQRQELTGINFLPSIYDGEDVSLYDYDARGQLVTANYTTQTDETYQWDDNGNRNNGGFATGVNNQLTSDGTYTYVYDNEGNLTKRTKISGTDPDGTKTREFAWDHRNRLVKVTNKNTSNGEINRVEYAYDGDDHMIRRQVFLSGSSTPSLHQVFAYSDGQITLQFEKAGSGALTRTDLAHRYLWGPAVDELLADEDINSLTNAALNTVLWPLTDHLGTIRDWVNNSAAVVDHVEYDSFGNRLDTPAIDAAFGWTGRYRDPLTGLQYNNARWYDPAIGRWLSEDPIGFAGGDANLSRYVGNQSTMLTDPTGLIGDGHHLVNQANWRGMPRAVRAYFDSVEARIRNEYYTLHNSSTVNGISHECYNQEVAKELQSFLGSRKASSMTVNDAKAFLARINNSSNPSISAFNKGIRAEAYAAEEIGRKAYDAAIRAGKGAARARQEAIDQAGKAVTNTRQIINDAAAKKLKKSLGKRLLSWIPFVGSGIVLCETGDVNAAGREAFLELTGLDLARDGAELLGAGYDAIVRDGDAFAERVRNSEKYRFP